MPLRCWPHRTARSANLDVRVGAGTIQTTTPGLTVTTQPAAQFAIFKFTTKNSGGTANIDVTKLTITIGAQELRHHPRFGYERALCRPARRRRSGRQILCHGQRQQDLHLL